MIAVSASVMPDDQQKIVTSGFDAFVTKPINLKQFLDTVKRFLAHGRTVAMSAQLAALRVAPRRLRLRRGRARAAAMLAAIVALAVALASWPSLAEAQAPAATPRIGLLSFFAAPTAAHPDPNEAGFRQGLREAGYVEGQNVVIERRFADGQRRSAATPWPRNWSDSRST